MIFKSCESIVLQRYCRKMEGTEFIDILALTFSHLIHVYSWYNLHKSFPQSHEALPIMTCKSDGSFIDRLDIVTCILCDAASFFKKSINDIVLMSKNIGKTHITLEVNNTIINTFLNAYFTI